MSFCGVVRDIVLMGANPIKDARRKEIRPHRRCSGRDHPDGINNKVQVYLGGVTFFCQNPQFLIGRDALLQKTLFFTIFFGLVRACARPGPAKQKWKKNAVFYFSSSIFGFEMRFFSMCLVGKPEKQFLWFQSCLGMVFAVFVGQKRWFLQCSCPLPRLDGFARKCKKNRK